MSALLFAVILLAEPPATTPASPAPPAAEAKPDKSLAGAAKKARKGAPAAKVLTNEDLDKARAGGAAVSVLAAEGGQAATPSEGGSADENPNLDGGDANAAVPKDEATWRQRADAARARITDAAAIVASAEQRLAELRSDIAPDTADPQNPFRMQTRESEVKVETERLESSRAELAAAKQALTDLEDEARRASIPPGWLRER
jgi:hypothetical protein